MEPGTNGSGSCQTLQSIESKETARTLLPSLVRVGQTGGFVKICKYHCEQRFGVVSQCLLTGKALVMPFGYFDNFLLKGKDKLGGLNAVLDPAILNELPFAMDRTMLNHC